MDESPLSQQSLTPYITSICDFMSLSGLVASGVLLASFLSLEASFRAVINSMLSAGAGSGVEFLRAMNPRLIGFLINCLLMFLFLTIGY